MRISGASREARRDGHPAFGTNEARAAIVSSQGVYHNFGWRGETILLCILVVLAFLLRLHRIARQSLWGDETISVFRAYGPIPQITEATLHEGTLPPLYYYVLHYWIRLVGDGEFAIRFLSLIFGVLAVPLVYALVRRAFDGRVGVIAALLAACSPFWIYYSQETRTYAQVTAFLILALYLLVRSGYDNTWIRSPLGWAAYAVAAALAVSSHYFAGFALAAAVLWLLVDRSRWPGVATRAILAQIGTLTLLLPLLLYVGPSLLREGQSVSRGSIPLATEVRRLALVFNFGGSIPSEQVGLILVVAVTLAIVGLLFSPPRVALLWAFLVAIPVLAVHEVSYVQHQGWERYFIAASPGWYALLASGLYALANWRPGAAIPRRIVVLRGQSESVRASTANSSFQDVIEREAPSRDKGDRLPGLSSIGAVRWGLASIAGLVVLAGMGMSLHNYYDDPAYWRNDLRSAEKPVEAVATPDVAVIVNGPPQFPSFFYYFHKTIPWFELPAQRASGEQTLDTLNTLTKRYRGLWFVKYHPPDFDPNNLIEVWLDQHAYLASSRWMENMTFSFYLDEDGLPDHSVVSSPVGRTFGDDAELVAYRATLSRSQNADYLLVSLSWRAARTPPDSLRVFAHLVDRSGAMVTQSDHFPEADLRPASTWRPGEIMDDRFALKLPVDYPTRGLVLEVGLYRTDGSRLPIRGLNAPNNSLTLPLPGLRR